MEEIITKLKENNINYEEVIKDIETISPIPEYTIESIKLFTTKNPEYQNKFFELIKNKNFLNFICKSMGYSKYIINSFIENPNLLFEVFFNINESFTQGKLEKETFESELKTKSEIIKKIKEVKKREFLKIVIREMLDFSSFEETSKELSILADEVLETILKINFQELSKKYGTPSSEFCIISLGKLGGNEINYSSDIDVIFVYEKDGTTDKGLENLEFFDNLAKSIIHDISSSDFGEFLYRIDTRLRPDGEFGALVRSEQSYYNYYEERAQIWEIQMLIKARVSAGDRKLGERFISNIKKIIYSSPLTDSEIAEILGIKQKIKGEEHNLKKSTGGIRDIEFIVQLLQLTFGMKNEELRTQNTLQAINKLKEHKVITNETSRILSEGYINLRKLENYIQLYQNLQDFYLPIKDEKRMIGLFRLLHRVKKPLEGNEDKRLLELINYTKRDVIKVKTEVFEKLLDLKMGEESIFFLYNSEEEKEIKDLLLSYGIKDTKRAFSFIESMISSSFRGGIESTIGLKNLLRAISNSIIPDKSLSNIYYILEATQNLPISIQFFTDQRNVNFIYNISLLKDRFINILRKRNWIWDGMMDTNAFMDYLKTFLQRIDFKHPEIYSMIEEVYETYTTSLAFLRINNFITSKESKEILTTMYDKIFYEATKYLNGNLCILSLGRLATRKITFFSDVDLIYIIPFPVHSDKFEEVKKKILYIHDNLSKIFEIDTRLVEGAHKGSPFVSIETLKEMKLEIWQIVAYLKSRPITSNQNLSEKIRKIIKSKLIGHIKNLNIDEYLIFAQKVVKTFQTKEEDIKKGRGNLLEIELALDKILFKSFKKFDKLPIAKPLSEVYRMLKEEIPIPLDEYLNYLTQIEDIIKITEGIEFNEKYFKIFKLPISYEDFVRLKNKVIEWCNKELENK
ncbi:MAG: hypothetical protein ACP5QP_02985 [Brevinematia bacterium]